MKEQQEKEMELWKTWKKTGDESVAENILVSMEPLIMSQLSPWKGRLPESAVNAKGVVLARKALNTFDPSKGVKLSTHVVNQMLPVSRLIYRYTNVGKIPEDRIRLVRAYGEALQSLQDELNRRPSDAEVADRMGVGVRKVGLIRREAWRDIIESGAMSGIHPYSESSKAGEILDFVYYSLAQPERAVFEKMIGYNGHKPLDSIIAIARETGIPEPEVRRIRRKIVQQVKEASR